MMITPRHLQPMYPTEHDKSQKLVLESSIKYLKNLLQYVRAHPSPPDIDSRIEETVIAIANLAVSDVRQQLDEQSRQIKLLESKIASLSVSR